IRERVIEPFELVVQVADAAAAENRLLQHRTPRAFLDVLAEIAYGQLLRNRDLAFVRHLFADDQPEERRLSGSVRADKPHGFPGIELERRVDEQDLLAVLLADAGQRNHEALSYRTRGRRLIDVGGRAIRPRRHSGWNSTMCVDARPSSSAARHSKCNPSTADAVGHSLPAANVPKVLAGQGRTIWHVIGDSWTSRLSYA